MATTGIRRLGASIRSGAAISRKSSWASTPPITAKASGRGITRWFAAMEPTLVRLLNRFGIRMRQIGPETEYFGKVAPYAADVSEMERIMFETNPDLLRAFADGLEADLVPYQLEILQS